MKKHWYIGLLCLVLLIMFPSYALAIRITVYKDVVESNKPSEYSNHDMEFQVPDGLAPGYSREMDVTFAAQYDLSAIDIGDVDLYADGVNMTLVTGMPLVVNEVKFIKNSNTLRFEFHDDLSVPDNHPMRVVVGTNAVGGVNKIKNPLTAGVYFVYIQTYQDNFPDRKKDNGEFANNISEGVTVTATVPSSLTFTVAGVSSGAACPNSGGNASVTSTSAAIPFGTYTGAQTKIACQTLTVSTNAGSGYIVSLQQNQDLTNVSSNTMGKFTGTYSTPTIWASPISPTKSFFGFTTNDTDLTNFQTNKYAQLAINNTPYTIMQATHSVANEGNVISYQLEVNNLQEAGVYSNTLMYIVTGTF